VPFLRVLRDRRGYETTYLMHWFREGSRQRSRVLYIFRTPANVRVGRSALDTDALRDIEARYPDIAFNWDEVREQQHVIEPGPPMRRRRPKREEGEAPPSPVETTAPPEPQDAAPAAPAPRPIPSSIEGATPDEQMAFLMLWYPVVRDRIAARATEPERREALAALAERLNPAAWTDADQIASGLQQASEALERLSRVLVRRRRRARRRPASTDPSVAPVPPDERPKERPPQES
jgi:hypothetical protein